MSPGKVAKVWLWWHLSQVLEDERKVKREIALGGKRGK